MQEQQTIKLLDLEEMLAIGAKVPLWRLCKRGVCLEDRDFSEIVYIGKVQICDRDDYKNLIPDHLTVFVYTKFSDDPDNKTSYGIRIKTSVGGDLLELGNEEREMPLDSNDSRLFILYSIAHKETIHIQETVQRNLGFSPNERLGYALGRARGFLEKGG